MQERKEKFCFREHANSSSFDLYLDGYLNWLTLGGGGGYKYLFLKAPMSVCLTERVNYFIIKR